MAQFVQVTETNRLGPATFYLLIFICEAYLDCEEVSVANCCSKKGNYPNHTCHLQKLSKYHLHKNIEKLSFCTHKQVNFKI